MRLIAFDLDGTLLDDEKNVPQRSRDAVRQLRNHGCKMAVITGRAAVADDILAATEPDATAVNNGGTLKVGGRVIAEHLLTPGQVEAVLALAPQGAEVTVHTPDSMFVPDLNEPRFAAWAAGKTLRSLTGLAGQPAQKLGIIHPEAWRVLQAVRAVKGVTVTGGVPPYEHFLTVTPKAANKGQALRDIAHALHIPLEHTVAFGDSDNDVAMLQAAGTAIGVGDAACLDGHAHHRVSCAALGLPGWLEHYLAQLARDLDTQGV